jgi:uncharacterized SAM-binding protein YcdF (DUF218 family)
LLPLPSSLLASRLVRAGALIALLAVAFGTFACFHVGTFLAREDPLSKADAIFVLAGTLAERPLEAADLFREGYAPRIVVTRAELEQAVFHLERQGIDIVTEFDLNKEILLRVGVPEDALVTPAFVHDNTAEEARTLRELVDRHAWRSVIVVSSKYHLRRSGIAMRRALEGTDVEIILRGSRYDEATPEEWWKRRRDIRWLASELPKLLAYALGVGS